MKKENKKPKVKAVRKKKIELSEDSQSSYYKTSYKAVSSSAVQHWVYLNVDSEHIVDSFTPKGTRLLVARYPDFYKIFLYKTHAIGEPSWPKGGVEVYNSNYETMQYFYFDSVAIHPEGGSYKFNG